MKQVQQTIEASRLWQIVIVMAVSILVASFFFKTALLHPSSVFYASEGDGIKNYYTPMWYVAHDTGAKFTGMNYPYAENIVYSDNQPILSYCLKLLSARVHITSSHVLAVLNLLPILSLIFGCLLVYYLLRRANLPYWYALFFAVIINYHSPQVARLLGAHYGLSYVCFIPLMWICIDRLLNGKSALIWAIVIALTLSIFTFLHMYYLPIGAFMALGYATVHLFQHPKQFGNYYTRYALLLTVIAVPLVLSKLWLAHYYAYPDRVSIPYGLDLYHASFYSLFIPEYAPHPYSAYYNFEGIAYVGWFGLVVLALTLIKGGSYLMRRQFKLLAAPAVPSILVTAPWLGVIFFLLANASILVLLTDRFPAVFEGLRQFRSVGRFAWVFYYLFTVWSVWLLYVLLRRLRMKGLGNIANSLLFIFCMISAYETYFYLHPIKKQLYNSYHENDAKNFIATNNSYADWVKVAGYKTSDFQAILPIPFYYSGSEKVGSIFSSSMVFESLKASLSTGLPIATAYTTRASIGQSNRIVQMLANPLIQKSVLQDYPSLTKPLLIVYNKKKIEQDDSTILSYSRRIFSNEYIELYSLQPKILDSIYHSSVTNARQQVDLGKILPPVFFENFDNAQNKDGISNTGAFVMQGDKGLVSKWVLPATLAEDSLIVTCWVKILTRYNGLPQLFYQLNGKNRHQETVENPANSHDVVGNWVITKTTFANAQGGDTLVLSAVGKQTVLDNFLVRYNHQHAWVAYPVDSIAGFYDGYLIPRKATDAR